MTVGRLVRPHGVRGELVVDAAGGELLGTLEAGQAVYLDPGGLRQIVRIRPHAGRWLLWLQGIDDRTAAEEHRGARVQVAAERLPELHEGEFYVDDLVDARVQTVQGELLGRVVAVHFGAAQEILELERDGETALIPMVRDWLVEADPDAGRIVLDLPDGFAEATRPPERGRAR